MSGIDYGYIEFRSPTGVDFIYNHDWGNGELELTQEGSISIPQFIEPGLYTLNYYQVRDLSGNYGYYYPEDFYSWGFPTEFFVINNPSVCDILGDINDDLILNVQDIVLIINLILDGEYDECGDINSDGEINVLDVVTVVNIILEL